MAAYVYVKYGIVLNIVNSDTVPPSINDDGSEVFPWDNVTLVGSPWNMGAVSSTIRTASQNQLNDRDKLGLLHRAVASVLVDEINALRDWITSFKAAVAAATSLANLQTRVAALADLPDRTLAQARTAITNKITGGTVDN